MTRLSPSEAKNRIIIGKVGAPHGVRGELKITPLTDFPDRFNDLKKVFAGNELLTVDTVRYHNQTVLIKFAEYPVREDAAKLTGRHLSVDRADAVPLEEGQYYIGDIIGLEVFDEAGNKLGKVTEVLPTGSNDVYVVAQEGNSKELLIPALKKVVLQISVPEGKMVVRLQEEI